MKTYITDELKKCVMIKVLAIVHENHKNRCSKLMWEISLSFASLLIPISCANGWKNCEVKNYAGSFSHAVTYFENIYNIIFF